MDGEREPPGTDLRRVSPIELGSGDCAPWSNGKARGSTGNDRPTRDYACMRRSSDSASPSDMFFGTG